MSLIVGAYPAQPAGSQQEFYRGLATVPAVRGLELPYGPHGGSPWPAGAPAEWSAVVTSIPGTMQRLNASAAFGLASVDAAGRRKALDFAAGLHAYVLRLKDEGRQVEAVELHSAPHPGADVAMFRASLSEILEWDWGTTRVLVEHCDAPRPGNKPEKGFLPFADEVDVVRALREQSGGRAGLVINWARSVIETRNPDTAAQHIALAREAGVLAGVMFSGCSPDATEFGYPWIDAHLPAVEVDGAPPSSLLNRAEIERCLAAAGAVPVTGFKVGLPREGLTVQDRVDRLRQMCALIGGS
ncbi:UDP-N-acetylglucosamine pyrophosphorylase [Pseudarthrobacter chlorophenolicus A6]|uniref:UDP-N-acetylglucosamine pyrophosphorylase n=1 Tax=Pseudarthrobacter chlorophenolicus (strain ATCC 700700 / DSM 12829 / CIP 107037 / JCM 12360 / KCTC 9906 / NCIMB 13794 / A6) TaxID=452863 RepID=B8HGS7_PSECP|nr:DUF4862 family protein [Pseudarthrobacter chlorophenolicus]ACL41343.1 UDP-N-acetylglucosamine pyrophosphorylase [Pseudarthrobacter chlorophenolicus A6]